ncbi:signal peptidase, endoplasmic reticulum-type [Halogranum gelatinilyticum]|uniref:Signal peptidase, endoplasmic reticulum-type n=2 Tax=Halogranum gelatinilyticum TaxID=660521 RepID=A0A1G9NVC3_9EURY|nr:S26 family signal peptidase [Halogranum gelatinilyticum]SDL90528.1 signal peptidase, endoplasmic reticulum-type [Halogranum gelatinilyticum]
MSQGDSRPPSDDSPPTATVRSGGESREADEDGSEDSLLTRFRTAQTGPLMFVRELLTSVVAVLLVGLLLFSISGVWPPMVAVESGSMEPHMEKGDLIFITEPGRFAPDAARDETGVVTYEDGEAADYRTFGSFGSVVVYDNPERFGPPIIHRARFWVDDGENWYDQANPDYIRADNCQQLLNCPAPHAGFITKGDANAEYDQANGISSPVRPEWVQGVARVRIPYLGWVRLGFSGAAFATPPAGGVEMAAGSSVAVADATAGSTPANATTVSTTAPANATAVGV